MEKTDEQLTIDYIAGDENALNEIIQRYLKPIYNFAYRYSSQEGEAQDITQETFVKVWKNIKRFDTSKKFKTWIFQIAKNTALDHLKKKSPLLFSKMNNLNDEQGIAFEDTISDEALRADDLFDQKIESESVLKVIAELPSDYKAVLILRYSEDLSFQEIGEVLNKPLNTVKSQYRRAVAMIKKKLS